MKLNWVNQGKNETITFKNISRIKVQNNTLYVPEEESIGNDFKCFKFALAISECKCIVIEDD